MNIHSVFLQIIAVGVKTFSQKPYEISFVVN